MAATSHVVGCDGLDATQPAVPPTDDDNAAPPDYRVGDVLLGWYVTGDARWYVVTRVTPCKVFAMRLPETSEHAPGDTRPTTTRLPKMPGPKRLHAMLTRNVVVERLTRRPNGAVGGGAGMCVHWRGGTSECQETQTDDRVNVGCAVRTMAWPPEKGAMATRADMEASMGWRTLESAQSQLRI